MRQHLFRHGRVKGQMGHPAVNVIIPTHKGRDKYVKRILHCLEDQTFKDFDVMITDNDFEKKSPPDFVKQSWGFKISYIVNKKDLGPLGNMEKALSLCKAKYIKPIMSDDLIAQTFLEDTFKAMDANPSAVMAFGRRILIDEDDNFIKEAQFYEYSGRHSGLIDGRQLLKETISRLDWFPGEPSNFLFRNGILEWPGVFKSFTAPEKLSYKGSFDLILYLKLLSRGDAYFINNPLSYIRDHDSRALTQSFTGTLCHLDYFHFAHDAYKLEIIKIDDYYEVVAKIYRFIFHKLMYIDDMSKSKLFFIFGYIYKIMLLIKKESETTDDTDFKNCLMDMVFGSTEMLICRNVLKKLLSTNTMVYGYGTGGYTRKLYSNNHPITSRIVGFIDSDKGKSGAMLYGKPIIHIDELKKSKDEYILILSAFYEELTDLLKDKGYQNIIDFCWLGFLI